MKTRLIILGCGNSTGVPRIDGYWGKCNKKNRKNKRTRCSAAIIRGSNSILIDTSPDVRTQLFNNKIKSIKSVLFTHEHADQTNGLFELRPFSWKENKKINVYGNLRTIKLIKKRFDYCFKHTPYYPPIAKSNLIKKKFSIGKGDEKINFITLTVRHGKTHTIGYVFEKVAYLSDCNDLSIVNRNILKNLNFLILDCLKIKPNFAHFNLKNALYVHKKLKPKKTILTNLHSDLDYNYLLSKLPKGIIPAYDRLKLNL